jgi:hypothetical protein
MGQNILDYGCNKKKKGRRKKEEEKNKDKRRIKRIRRRG